MPKSTLGNEEMITAEEIMITTECEEFINNHINRRTTSDEPKPDVIVVHDNDSSDSGSDNCWMMIDKIFLYNTDKDVLKSKTMWLNDTHITCTDPPETSISSVWWVTMHSPTANQIPQITTSGVTTDFTHTK